MRSTFDFSRLSLISICALVLGSTQIVSAQTLPVVSDAHVSSAFPSVNFGSAPLLQVGATAGAGTTQAYLQFDLTTLPAGTNVANITKVNLILFINRIGTAGTLNVAEAAGSWTESGITNSNAPGVATAVGTITLPANSDYVTIDVTNSVVAWLSSTRTNNGFVIGPNSSAAAYLDSKESVTTSHAAILSFQQAGPQGATGATGTNGLTGATGATGSNGSNGATGATGATGSNGSNGATGATGATGSNGSNGATGATGATGSNGSNGTTGATGATGSNGSNGTTGATGTTGSNGSNGATGATGATGSNGSNGATGATGATGSNGSNGATGATGATGSNGSNGTTGATGATGSNGSNGTTGATGATGSNGSNGTTGANGLNGATGPSGVTGASGASNNSFSAALCTDGCNGTGVPGVNNLAKFESSGAIAQSYTSPQTGVVGIVTAINGSAATVQTSGPAVCQFSDDNAGGVITAGHYVQASTDRVGYCRDAGATSPTSGQIIGVALANGSNLGTVLVHLLGPEVDAVGGAGGATGATGASGADGATGPTGASGFSGSNGATGATGSNGATGATGSNGATGATGSNGATGATGSNGATGATGANGTNGSNGATGANGTNGATGPTGTVAAGGVAQMLVASLSSLGTTGTFSVGVTGSTPIVATTNETFEEEVVSSSGTLSNMYVRVIVGTANAYQLSVTLYKNGGATGITCSTVVTPATALSVGTCSDTSHTVSVVAGDSLAYVFQPNASNSNNKISVAIHIQ